jgi:hypothetical protein
MGGAPIGALFVHAVSSPWPALAPPRWPDIRPALTAWLGRNRRLAKDFEATLASATAFLYAASALLLTRRLAHAAGRG